MSTYQNQMCYDNAKYKNVCSWLINNSHGRLNAEVAWLIATLFHLGSVLHSTREHGKCLPTLSCMLNMHSKHYCSEQK